MILNQISYILEFNNRKFVFAIIENRFFFHTISFIDNQFTFF